MDEVQLHPSSAHLATISQDTAVHFEFAFLVKVRHEAVVLRELKLTILVVVKKYDVVVFFHRVRLSDQMARLFPNEVDDDGRAICRLLEKSSIGRHKEGVANSEDVAAFHTMITEI